MSIANKLIYLNGTKENLKESINNIGGSITDETTFRAYATELDNIYSNIPKTTGEGSNLSLSTIKGRINVDDILGDTTQEGTPTPSTPIDIEVVTGQQEVLINGTNLLDESTLRQGAFNGNADANRLYFNSNYYLEAGTYTLITNFNSSTLRYAINVSSIKFPLTTTNVIDIYNPGWTNALHSTFTLTTGGYFGLGISKTNGTDSIAPSDISSYWFMLYKGSYDSTIPYTPYQEQTKTLHLSSNQLFDKDNASLIFNGFPNASTGLLTTNDNARTICLPCQPNTTYTISKTLSARFLGAETSSNTISTGISVTTTSSYASVTHFSYTTSASAKYLLVFYYLSTADTLTEEEIRNSIMINEGSTALSYEAYYNYELSKIGTYQDRIFETSGKQMLNVTATSQTKNNITFTIDNGIVKANGTGNSTTGLILGQVQLEAGKTYYLSGCASGGGSGKYTLSIDAENDTTRLVDDTGSGASYTPSTSGTYDIRLNYWYNYNIQNLTFYPMVSTTQTSYEPYGSDKWYIEKNIGKAIITGSTGSFSRTTTNRFNIDNAITNYMKQDDTKNYLSDKYVAYDQKSANSGFDSLVSGVNSGFGLSSSSSSYTIRIKDTNYDNVDNYKTYLNSNNLTIYYALATPTYTEITNTTLLEELNELEKMMSYNGTTNISISGNLPMILNVSALKGE